MTESNIYNAEVPYEGKLDITAEQYQEILSISQTGFMKDINGSTSVINIVKCTNAYAILDKTELKWIATRFDILRKSKDSNNRCYIDLQTCDEIGFNTVKVLLNNLSEKKIADLSKFNILISPEYLYTMHAYTYAQVNELPMQGAGTNIGVHTANNGTISFNAYNSINPAFTVANSYKSTDDYINELNRLIKDNPALQLTISIAMACPLLSFLKNMAVDVNSFSVSFVGDSSKGKTTAIRCAASMFSNPNDSNIFSSFFSSSNAALKELGGRYGIPTILDEATVISNINPSEFIYTVAEEREKKRLNSDCSMKENGTWQTIVMMTSEQHFFSTDIKNSGLAVRLHSYENLEFTKNAKHAEELTEFVKQNYGIIGKEFTDDLFDNHFVNVLEKYNAERAVFADLLKGTKNKFTARLTNHYSIISLAAVLLTEIGLDLQIDAIRSLMKINHDQIAVEENLAVNSCKAILSFILRHQYESGTIVCEKNNNVVTVYGVEESLFTEILKKAKVTDTRVAVTKMLDEGFIVRQQKGRRKSKLNFNGQPGYGYKINVSKLFDDTDFFEEISNLKKFERKLADQPVESITNTDVDEAINF